MTEDGGTSVKNDLLASPPRGTGLGLPPVRPVRDPRLAAEVVADEDRTATPGALAGLAGLAVLAALAVRLVLLPRMAVLQADGCEYLWIARDLAAGRFVEALSEKLHPLFPAIVALVVRLTGAPLEATGYGVSIALGSLAAAPLFLAFRRATASARAGLAGALLYAVHPYAARSGADVMSEATFFFFVALATHGGLRALEGRPRLGSAALAGFAAGLAFLVRPEGLAVPLAIGVVLAWRLARGGHGGRGRTAAAAIVLAVATAAAAGPYVAWNSKISGEPVLTRKKPALLLAAAIADPVPGVAPERPGDLRELISGAGKEAAEPPAPEPPASRAERLAACAAETLVHYFDVLHPLFALFALAGIAAALCGAKHFARQSEPGAERPGSALALIVITFLALAFLARVGAGYVHKRHVEIAACLSLAASGAGAVWFAERLARRLSRPRLAPVLLAAAVLAILLPKTFAAQFTNHLGVRAAGEAMRAHGEKAGGGAILVMGHGATEIAYYGGGREISMPVGRPAEVLAQARAQAARYLAFSLRARAGPPDRRAEEALAALGLRPFYSADDAVGGRFYRRVIYDLDDPPAR